MLINHCKICKTLLKYFQTVKMKFIPSSALLYLGVLTFISHLTQGNEDVVRDLVLGNYDSGSLEVAKRAMQQSQGLNTLADAFSSMIGTKNLVKSASGSSIRIPYYPRPISQQSDYVRNCLGYIPSIGKRDTVEKREIKKFANRDYVFVLDTSGSVLGSEFEAAKEAIASLIESFCPLKFGHEVTKEGSKQVSMVLFGSRVTKVIDFEDSLEGLEHLQNKVMEVKHRREGMTSTATALSYVKEAILGQKMSRVNNPNVTTDVIVITDGRCNVDCKNLAKEADAIRSMGNGVNIFAVGVAAARECELDIISGKNPKASFELDGMNNFRDMAEFLINKARSLPQKCV